MTERGQDPESFFGGVAPTSPKIPANAEYIGGLRYSERNGRSLLLDLYLPVERSAKELLPLVLYLFGGAWMMGNRYQFGALIPGSEKLFDNGYAVAAVDYRLSHEAIFPAQIHDVKSAIYWLRTHSGEYGIDTERFAAWGPSAGGHLSALAGTSAGRLEPLDAPEDARSRGRVQAVVDFFGPTDFLAMGPHSDSSFDHSGPDSPESRLVGGPIANRVEAVRKANPVTYISGDEPPFLVVHGTDDRIVPFNQSEILVTALRSVQVDVTFYPVEEGGHGNGGEFDSPALMDLVVAFLDRHLKP